MNPPAFLLAAFTCLATFAHAETQTFRSPETRASLLELYTSEGCSSCPPAEAWMGQLRESPQLWKGVVPVAFHVDYWDRLGWPDRFAKAEFTARQHRYASQWRSRSVYTPGFVLNGGEWRGWFQKQGIPAADGASAGVLSVELIDRTKAKVSFAPAGKMPANLQVDAALLAGGLDVDVKRGENAGRRLRHDFIVLDLETAPLTRDGDNFTGTVNFSQKPAAAPTAFAAWITPGDAQPPIQATGGWLGKQK